jgi:hypothetical protein
VSWISVLEPEDRGRRVERHVLDAVKIFMPAGAKEPIYAPYDPGRRPKASKERTRDGETRAVRRTLN